jgi:Flp pilus assembly protein TadG
VRSLRELRDDDGGNAIIEFIFVAVIVLVPLVYLIVSVADIERSSLAVGQAAREAGRAFATGDSTSDGLRRAQVAARLAMGDQGLTATPQVTFRTGPGCSSAIVNPVLRPGAEYTVCVERTVQFDGVPSILAGGGVRTVGEYVVHVDDYRTVDR